LYLIPRPPLSTLFPYTTLFRSALLMDETVKQTTEECMVVVRGGRVVGLTKRMPERYDFAGEGVGFLKVRRADTDALINSLKGHRSEEHTSELQSRFDLVCRLLL